MKKNRLLLFFVLIVNYAFAQQIFKPNDVLPVFKSTTSNNFSFTLDSILANPTVIVCWATWNVPSLQLLETINEVYTELNPIKRGVQQQTIQVIDFSIDTHKDLYTIFLSQHKWPWSTHLIDFNGWESDLTTILRLQKIPTILIVDTNRKILAVDVDIKQLKAVLTNLTAVKSLSN